VLDKSDRENALIPDLRVLVASFIGVALAVWLAACIVAFFPFHASQTAPSSRIILSQWNDRIVEKFPEKLYYAVFYVLGGVCGIAGAVWYSKRLARVGWTLIGLLLWVPLLNHYTAAAMASAMASARFSNFGLIISVTGCLFLTIYVSTTSGKKPFQHTIFPVILFAVLLLSGLSYAL
jgi:hypothetical protein